MVKTKLLRRVALGLREKARLFLLDREATIVVTFVIMLPMLIGCAGLSMDTARSYLVRQRLGNAIDAAALSAAASETDPDLIKQKVSDYFAANYPSRKIGLTHDLTTLVDTQANTITVSAYADYNTSFMRILGIDKITVYRTTTVQRKVGANIELALVLDISGSMNNNSKISELIDAANSLVDTVVYDDQSEYYSKIALVPYSVAVNAGSYADAARGAVLGPLKSITGATRASPVVVTAAAHGFANAQTVYIKGVSGMSQINNKQFTVAGAATDTFALSGINGASYGAYGGSGTAGRLCTTPGCEYYKFTSATGSTDIFDVSPCVSERTGSYAYTDDPPSTATVGWAYLPSGNPCLSNMILPLTSDKTALHNNINALVATGSTGGQVGIAWGWYMLAPNWGYLWPAESVPAAYNTANLHKIAVIMTDGELNSPYCNGAIAKDATSGSGNTSDHVNCNATNGDSYTQGENLCDGMKAAGIEIYTIGFEVDTYPNGKALMQYCATDAGHFYNSQNGSDLMAAFQAIAKNVSALYVSK
jgi:Flp pilus assembly protein TadG